MATVKLSRQLLYKDYGDESQLNTKEPAFMVLGNILHDIKQSDDCTYDTKMTRRLPMLNEAYYQCIRAYNDNKIVSGFYSEYVEGARRNLKSRTEVEVTFALIEALLHLQDNLSDRMQEFLSNVELQNKESKAYKSLYRQVIHKYLKKYTTKFTTNFAPHPVNPRDFVLDNGENSWHAVTQGFDKDSIRSIVLRYQRKENQSKVLNLIYANFLSRPDSERDLFNWEESSLMKRNGKRQAFVYDAENMADDEYFITFKKEIEGEEKKDDKKKSLTEGDNPMSLTSELLVTLYDYLQKKEYVEEDSFKDFYTCFSSTKSLKRDLEKSTAREDMLVQENTQLKERIKELETELDDKRTLVHDLKEHQNDTPEIEKTPLDEAVNMYKIVDLAVHSHDVELVDNIMTALYRLTGRVVSEEKDKLLDKLAKWSDLLHAKAQGINIKEYNQYGGQFNDETNIQ